MEVDVINIAEPNEFKSDIKSHEQEFYFYKEANIGYDYSNINSEYICWSCNKIINNPYQSADCGCISCLDCLEQKLKTENKCLKCGEPYTTKKKNKDNSINKEIKDLEVKCAGENCSWKGKLSQHKAHLQDKHIQPCLICQEDEKFSQKFPKILEKFKNSEAKTNFQSKADAKTHFDKYLIYHMLMVYFNLMDKFQLLDSKIQSRQSKNLIIPQKNSDPLETTKPNNKRKSPTSGSIIFCRSKIDVAEKKIKEKLEPIESRISNLEYKHSEMKKSLSIANKENELIARQCASYKELFESLKTVTNDLKRACALNQVKLLTIDEKLLNQEKISFNGVLLWKITNVDQRIQDAKSGKQTSFYSQPFYTDKYGYKMCARIYLNGDGNGRNTHLSLFFVILRGEYDALLKWPFGQKVTFILIDQSMSESKENVYDAFRPDPNSSSFRQPISEMNVASGLPVFCPLGKLLSTDHEYIKDNTMFIKIVVDTKDLESNDSKSV